MSIFNVLVRTDIWINVHVFKGYEGETISSRLGRHINRDGCLVCKLFCRIILLPLGLLINHDFKHCIKSVQDEYENK